MIILLYYIIYLLQLSSDEAVIGDEKGKIQLSIRYDSNKAQLYVGVIRCAALNIPSRDGYADPYVKL